ncbi:glycosyltransferase family 4 protein [Arthrobacter sp. M-10]|uniref:glycosyltransferase family 4 protein n=1 Tax=Arthrobacter sp. M-10 TaxID=3233037 RepID=UPI003F8DA5B7
MDIGFVANLLFRCKLAYFIHTQDHGLTGKTSDSMWRLLGGLHRVLERRTVEAAHQAVVFNPDYAETVQKWNPSATFSPTWFDPQLIAVDKNRDPYQLCWVGRLEVPKDPLLALETFDALTKIDPTKPWTLHFLGSGTLEPQLRSAVTQLREETAKRVVVHGRVDPQSVAVHMASSGIFLMTSHSGYEGYPRVLVEAMASGLPSVVTDGSDTGGLVINGQNGFVTSRDPKEIANGLITALTCDRQRIASSVNRLSAPKVVGEIYS